MKRILLLSLVLCRLPLLFAQEPARGPIAAVKVSQGPRIDGTLADPLWQKSPLLSLGEAAGAGKPTLATTARILMDERFLYIGMDCEEPDTTSMKKSATKRDGAVWEDDCIEIFLAADPGAGYKHITLNAANAVFDQDCPFGDANNSKWDGAINSQVTLQPNRRWTATLAVPLQDLNAYVGDNQNWKFNLTRTRYPRGNLKLQEYSWAVLPSNQFHNAEAFVELKGVNIPERADGVTRKREPGSEGQPRTIPIIFDTDIGTDIDDAYALALILASPELELRGVTTVSEDAYGRALIACQFLNRAGRPDIPVAAGLPRRATPESKGQYTYGLQPPSPKLPIKALAKEFMYEQLKAAPGKLTLVTVGDLTNVGELLTEHPDCKPWIRRIVLMGGAVRKKQKDGWEWNIHSDVKAAKVVFTSDLPILMAPLDATSVPLEKSMLDRIFTAGHSMSKELQTLLKLSGKPRPVLFDAVTVALCFNERFCKIEDLRIEVVGEGVTNEIPGKPNARVATSIQAASFLNLYTTRLANPNLKLVAPKPAKSDPPPNVPEKK